jgi:hypothetical protein
MRMVDAKNGERICIEDMATGPQANPIKANIVLYGALFANVGIAAAKFVASAISGRGSRFMRDGYTSATSCSKSQPSDFAH